MAPPPLITLEEHFFSTSVGSNPNTNKAYVEQFKHVPGLEAKLKNLSDLRLRDMDAGKVSFQVISHGPTPGAPSPQQCVEANDELAAAVRHARAPRSADLKLPAPAKNVHWDAHPEWPRQVQQVIQDD